MNQHSTSGFYKASVSKFVLGSLTVSHIALNIGALSNLQKYLVCKIPDSMNKGDWWRLFASKISFLETKDAIFCLVLIYYFRIFERRLGSRKFASHLIAMAVLSGLIEYLMTSLFLMFNTKAISGILSTGPYGIVLPWFVFYMSDIPSLNSTSVFGFTMSNKIMTYLLGLQVALGSSQNFIMAMSALVAGIIVKTNALWVQNVLAVPKWLSKSSHMLLGWIIDSSQPEQGAIGATLDIQRSQQMEALEQYQIQQQTRMNARRLPNQAFRQRIPQRPAVAPEPTEANITLLGDMGFPRQQAIDALREAHNDLSTATSILLRNT